MSWLSKAWNDISGVTAGNASRDAARMQAKAGRKASALYDPYMEAGGQSLTNLMEGNF